MKSVYLVVEVMKRNAGDEDSGGVGRIVLPDTLGDRIDVFFTTVSGAGCSYRDLVDFDVEVGVCARDSDAIC